MRSWDFVLLVKLNFSVTNFLKETNVDSGNIIFSIFIERKINFNENEIFKNSPVVRIHQAF